MPYPSAYEAEPLVGFGATPRTLLQSPSQSRIRPYMMRAVTADRHSA